MAKDERYVDSWERTRLRRIVTEAEL